MACSTLPGRKNSTRSQREIEALAHRERDVGALERLEAGRRGFDDILAGFEERDRVDPVRRALGFLQGIGGGIDGLDAGIGFGGVFFIRV